MFKNIPEKSDVQSNFEEAELFSQKLISLIEQVKIDRRMEDSYYILQILVDQYAESYNIHIKPSVIKESYYEKETRARKLIYNDHDDTGVYIAYLSRVTTYRGETDTFKDFFIKIGEKVIVDLQYQ